MTPTISPNRPSVKVPHHICNLKIAAFANAPLQRPFCAFKYLLIEFPLQSTPG